MAEADLGADTSEAEVLGVAISEVDLAAAFQVPLRPTEVSVVREWVVTAAGSSVCILGHRRSAASTRAGSAVALQAIASRSNATVRGSEFQATARGISGAFVLAGKGCARQINPGSVGNSA